MVSMPFEVIEKCRKIIRQEKFAMKKLVRFAYVLLIMLWVESIAIAAPVHLVLQPPVVITKVAPGVILVDFGRVAFGNIRFTPPVGVTNKITVHFGEALANGRINRQPPLNVRYSSARITLDGSHPIVASPPPDEQNTQTGNDRPPAILTPKEWGVIMPFRWVEIEGWPGELRPEEIARQAAFAATWDDDAANFACSDVMLNRVWDLCRYSIKATSFAGLFVDGDRERIPYEADAYLNQLSYYCTNRDLQMPRDTFDHLMKHGTWPTEWALHMVFMAHADWIQTGDVTWLASRYDALKTKLLGDRVGPDGLMYTNQENITHRDIVDWPPEERDGYVFTSLNTVVNAFYLRALGLMADMGAALGRKADADTFATRKIKDQAMFEKRFFDQRQGLYRDGVSTAHISAQANLFPLAFGLVPKTNRAHVAAWLAQRGMRCSVYGAQYLLEALFENGQSEAAIDLMIAPGDRSWRNMVESGTTITWEAWDEKYKPDQDWTHAWGAAPANLLLRFVIGVQPLRPGWGRASIRPHPGRLAFARGKMPTPRGPVLVSWQNENGFKLSVTLPKGLTARVSVPADGKTKEVYLDGKKVAANLDSGYWDLVEDVTGKATVELK
jgi:hypothetical protein